MSVILDPPELGFKRPFDREVCQVLHLNNENPDPVVFKVKTTAPKHYCVRPNSGRIEPGKNVEVHVLLQAMKDEPAPDAKCKDKFLVQSIAVTRDMEFANVTSIFEKSSKASIQERKIRVNWLAADSPAAEEGAETNGVNAPEEEPPAYTSPSQNYQTPAVGIASKANDVSPIAPPDFSEKPKRDVFAQSNETQTTSARSPTASTPTAGDDLKTQLSEANSQIQRLKEKLADQGLRQRKVGGETEKAAPTATAQQHHPQSVESGVPVQMVAGLCLLSFLIAYFFF